MKNNYGSRKSRESISTIFSKLQLQEDINFSHVSRVLTSFTLPHPSRVTLILVLISSSSSSLLPSPPYLLHLPISPFSRLLLHPPHQLLLFPTSFFSSIPDLQRFSSTFLAKNLGRSAVEIKQTLFSAFPTFSQSFFRAPPLSHICSHRKCFNCVEWSVRFVNCRVRVTIRTTLRRICLTDTAH